MAEVASAFVSLVPSTRGFGKSANSQLSAELGPVGTSQGKSIGGKLTGALGGVLKTGALGAAGIAGGLIGAALFKGFGRLSDLQEAESHLKGLGYTAKQAADIIAGPVTKAVTGTAFALNEAAATASGALASGVKGGPQLTRYLTLVGDAATQAGISFNDMGQIFNQVQGQGKLTGDVVNQLAQNGLYVVPILAQAMGKSQASIQKMVSAGQISAKEFQDALQNKIGGSAQKSGQTVSGAFDNMKAAFGRLGAKALAPVFDKLPSILSSVTKEMDALGPSVERVGTAIGTGLGVAISYLSTNLPPVIASIQSFFSGINTGGGQAGGVLTQLSATFSSVMTSISSTLTSIGSLFQSFVIIVTALWQTFGATIVSGIQSALSAVLTIVSGAFEVIAGIFKVFSALLQGDWQGVWDGIQQILEGAWKVIQGIVDLAWTNLETAFKLAGEAVKKVFGAIWTDIQTLAATGIKNLVDAVAAVPGKLLALLGKFKDAGKSLVEGLIHGLSNAGSAAADFASTIWQAVKSVINSGIDQLNALLEFKVAIPGAPDIHVNPPNIGHLFRGTNNWRGGPTWVGERGPEILNLPRGSQVVPNNQIGAVGPMTAGVGSTSSPSLDGATITIVGGGHMANSFQGVVNDRNARMVER